MSEGAVVREDRYHVALFDGTNYASWKLRVRVLLEEYELWDCVESDVGEIPEIVVKPEDAPAAQTAKQNRRELELKRRRKCRRLLIERIHDSHLEYVHDKVSPKQIWCTLQDVFQRKSIATRMHLKRQIVGMRFESGRLADHFLRFDRLVREFRGTGAVMEELDAVCHLLLSLGTAFPAVVTSIETMAEDNLTMEFVKCRLLDEETKQQGMGERESEMAAFYGARQQKKLRCFSCKKEGHKSVDCPAKKKQHSESANVAGSSERNSVCFVGVRGAEPQKKQRQVKWFLDSGAFDHLARDKQLFTDLHRLSEPIEIAVAKNGQSVVAEHCGTVKMTAFVNGRSIECTVKNVLFTPHLRHNLLSVVRIEQAGMRVVFENGKAQIYRGNELIVCGARRNSLYEMDFRTVDREKLLCDRAQTEHNLIALAECYMVSTPKQIVGRKCKKTIVCDTCGAGKQTPCGTWVVPSRKDVGYEAGERVEVGLERKQQHLVRPIAADADEPGGDPAEEEFGRWDEEPETEPNDREEEESGTAGADAEPGRGRGFALFATSYIDNITQTIAERTKPDEVIDSLGCNKNCSLTMLPIGRTPVTCKWSRWKRGDGVVADKYEANRNVPAGVFVGSSRRRRTRSQMDFSRGTPRGVGCVDCCVEV